VGISVLKMSGIKFVKYLSTYLLKDIAALGKHCQYNEDKTNVHEGCCRW